METENEKKMEEEGKPQPMAGFRVGIVTPTSKNTSNTPVLQHKTKSMVENDAERKENHSPPLLKPMAGEVELENNNTRFSKVDANREENRFVYFPVDMEVDKLLDWRAVTKKKELNNNNEDWNQNTGSKGALVKVNNTEVAVFKYGNDILATTSKCPHAGGPLHLGDIEVLPDKSLCIRCPWHKWKFCLAKSQQRGEIENFRRNLFSQERSTRKLQVGDCIFPSGRDDKKMKVYPTEFDTVRKQLKIGFESFDTFTLINETF